MPGKDIVTAYNDIIKNSPCRRQTPRKASRQRSVSQQNELISLKQMDNELNTRSSNAPNRSISFSGVSFVIDSLLKISSGINNQKSKEIEVAVCMADTEALKLLCSNDPSCMLAACIQSIDQSNAAVLETILDFSSPKTCNFLKDFGSELLIVAVQNEECHNCSIVLLQRGVSPNLINSIEKCSAMHAAAKTGNITMLEIMQKEYSGDVNLGMDIEIGSVLHFAVKANSPETVKHLLKNGAVTPSKKFASTALHYATEHNIVECARILVDNNMDLIDAFRDENKKETALHIAASNGYHDMCNLLLLNGANINAKKSNGETPLHLACKSLADCVIQLLIDKGADVNAKDNDGRPPLHCVINSGNKGGSKTLLVMLKNKAEINLADNYGNSPLHLAALNHKLARIKVLIESGADLCVINKAGKSAFYTTIKNAPTTIKLIENRLDAGLVLENPESEHEPSVRMDFTPILPQASVRSEVGLFTEVVHLWESDQSFTERLLMHPLSEGFLQLKWSQMKFLYYFGLVLPHLIYSIIYSVYAVSVFKFLCVPGINDSLLSKVNCNFDISGGNSDQSVRVGVAQTSWFFLIIFTIVYFAKEVTRFMHLRSRYIKSMESCLNVLVIASVLLISFYVNPFQNVDIVVYRWQYHACGIGVFITWLLQMLLIGKVPRFGKYVQMFKTVTKTFSNFFVAYIFLFVSFAVSFYILFPTQSAFKEVFPAAMVKVLVMMLGELEYDELYYPQVKTVNLVMANKTFGSGVITEETESQYFPFTAHVLVILFILFVSIIIMNLLFGLAVTDIQSLYKKAKLHQLIQQVELITYMENITFSAIFDLFPDCIQKVFWRMLQGLSGSSGYRRNIKIIRMGDYSDRSISINLKKRIMERCNILYKQEKKARTLEQDIQDIKIQLNMMETLVRENISIKNGPTHSGASILRDDLTSLESDDTTSVGIRQRSRSRDMPELRKLSNSVTVSLSKIFEEETSPAKEGVSKSLERL